ncbi:MAG: hypothetical protein JXJ20_01960 [Anaerolineae bacterium]|nr:hypothetical protein [Anaerolineae bacterium]
MTPDKLNNTTPENDEPVLEPDEFEEHDVIVRFDQDGDTVPAEAATAVESPDEPGPVSAAPPRIIAETPIGGKLPLTAAGIEPLPEPLDDDLAAPVEDELPVVPESEADTGSPDVVEHSLIDTEADTLVEVAPVDEEAVEEADIEAPAIGELLAQAESMADETGVPATPETPADVEPPAAPPVDIEADTAAPEDTPIPAPAAEAPALPSEPAAPDITAPSQAAPAPVLSPDEWDDDISPELASVLFGAQRAATAAPPADAAVRPVSAASAVAIQRPAPEIKPVPAAEPVELTDTAQARTLPIVAQGLNAPAPAEQPAGTARYQRIEDPLPADRGQRITERWDYRGPDRPALNGRQIKRVDIGEFNYADGSWDWTFKRQYTDGGFDRRQVRANTNRTYIERTDEIKARDPATNKRVRRQEQANLILAGPMQEENRGLLSRLRKRISGEDDGSKSWRPATPTETRRARKRGGDAF